MLVKYRMINKNMSIPRRDPEEYFCGHNEESFEENYEDMISSYLSQRHIYSASLPLPATTDSIMDQILSETQEKQAKKDSLKYNLRQQLLQKIISLPKTAELKKALSIHIEENTENMVEILEVTSSAEQSPNATKFIEINGSDGFSYDFDTDEFLGLDISQEIK